MDSSKYQGILQDNVMQRLMKLKIGCHWDLSRGQWPLAKVKINNGKDPTEVSEHPGVVLAVPWFNSHWEFMLGFVMSGGLKETNGNHRIGAYDHEEWTKIPQKCCHKLLSGYKWQIMQIIMAKVCFAK